MVPDIGEKPGHDTYGLIDYFFGPGRFDEHTDQHLVASWAPLLTPDPGDHPYGSDESKRLMRLMAERLDLPVLARHDGKYPDEGHVWHCPVRTAPGDRILSDAEWGEVARRIMHATGLAPYGDNRDVRWVAVRHASDHIHLLATLAAQDGRAPRHHDDAKRAQAECRKIEREFGLRQLNSGDGTAPPRPKRGEIAKAERRGQPEPSRTVLQDAVRQAMVGATTMEDFFAHLRQAGVLCDVRYFPSGDVQGYKVAAVGDTTADGTPIWFAGSRLGLSANQVLAQLQAPPDHPADAASVEMPDDAGTTPAAARRRATTAIEAAIIVVEQGDEADSARVIRETVEVVHALAETASADTRADLLSAARAWDRVALSHVRAARAQDTSLRRAARDLLGAGFSLSREDGGVTAWLLGALILLAVAAEHHHAQRGNAQQAAAAAESAARYRAVYRTVTRKPLQAMRERGQRLPAPARDRQAATVRSTFPEAERLLAEPTWDALAASLHEAQQAGHDPDDLLQRARAMRELQTADSETAVLAWRVRHLANLSAAPSPTKRAKPDDSRARRTGQTDPDHGLGR
ncbi:relaxase/mobilization nuclease domain-containing protein [Streptacidiphilus neutrinimicus]|uniref:relaxase/mobilization nuclease domain-containing protein n=1 Tax=Streptacidiphilus neutrinimicus TaxID=105420 RepID=UPI0005AB1018|nr:hypothetical protein [Streptacidiphilus neutrinimicus]